MSILGYGIQPTYVMPQKIKLTTLSRIKEVIRTMKNHGEYSKDKKFVNSIKLVDKVGFVAKYDRYDSGLPYDAYIMKLSKFIDACNVSIAKNPDINPIYKKGINALGWSGKKALSTDISKYILDIYGSWEQGYIVVLERKESKDPLNNVKVKLYSDENPVSKELTYSDILK